MIEINLRPEARAAKRRKTASAGRRRLRLSLPSGLRMPSRIEGTAAFMIAAWILAPLLGAWLFFGARSEKQDLALTIEQEQQDSVRYAEVIASVAKLTARRDTIARKLEVIQQIDAGRYVWAHVLDEVSRALPTYSWVTRIEQGEATGAGGEPTFQLQGVTGSNFALTAFMKNLEASPFIRDVTLVSTEQTQQGDAVVYSFMLVATYEQPPPDAVQTVPFFMTAGDDGLSSE